MTADAAGNWTDYAAQAVEDEHRDEQIAQLAPAPTMPTVAEQPPREDPQAILEQQADLVLTYVTDVQDHVDSILTLLGACRADAVSVPRGWGFECAADQFRVAMSRVWNAAADNKRDAQVGG